MDTGPDSLLIRGVTLLNVTDCGDERASDEHPDQGCTPLACQPDEYQCANYHCIRMSFACDGEDDCGDKSDEPDTCTYQSCSQDQFQCKGGRCIPKSHQCNGIKDCPDNSDEDPLHCPTTPKPQVPMRIHSDCFCQRRN